MPERPDHIFYLTGVNDSKIIIMEGCGASSRCPAVYRDVLQMKFGCHNYSKQIALGVNSIVF